MGIATYTGQGQLITRSIITAVGASNYSAPPGCNQIVVTMEGGGGGPGGSGTTGTTSGTVGGDTSFNGVVAKGGAFGHQGSSAGNAYGGTAIATGAGAAYYRQQGSCGGPGLGPVVGGVSGGSGGSSALGAGASDDGGNPVQDAPANGGGGGAAGASGTGGSGGGGKAGEYVVLVINNPSGSYPTVVGAGGNPGTSNLGNTGGHGGSGVILIEEFYPPVP